MDTAEAERPLEGVAGVFARMVGGEIMGQLVNFLRIFNPVTPDAKLSRRRIAASA